MGIQIEFPAFVSGILSAQGIAWLVGTTAFVIGFSHLNWRNLRGSAPLPPWLLALIGGIAFAAAVLVVTLIQARGIPEGPSVLEWLVVGCTLLVTGFCGFIVTNWFLRRKARTTQPSSNSHPPVILSVLGFWLGAAAGYFAATGLLLAVVIVATG